MKVLDFGEVHSFLEAEIKRHGAILEAAARLETTAENLKNFKGLWEGQGATALTERYNEIHVPSIKKQKAFSEIYVAALNKVATYLERMDNKTALWRDSFFTDDIPDGLNTLEDATEELVEEVKGIANSISDLIDAKSYHMNELLEATASARCQVDNLSEQLLFCDGSNRTTVRETRDQLSEFVSAIGKLA
ncbi:T7SS effector LXG polymorphic toxin [Bacillus sp. FSL W7-1360]